MHNPLKRGIFVNLRLRLSLILFLFKPSRVFGPKERNQDGSGRHSKPRHKRSQPSCDPPLMSFAVPSLPASKLQVPSTLVDADRQSTEDAPGPSNRGIVYNQRDSQNSLKQYLNLSHKFMNLHHGQKARSPEFGAWRL